MFIMALTHQNHSLWLNKKDSVDTIKIDGSEIIEIDEDIMDMDQIRQYVEIYFIDILEDQRMTRFELMEI